MNKKMTRRIEKSLKRQAEGKPFKPTQKMVDRFAKNNPELAALIHEGKFEEASELLTKQLDE